MHSNGHPQDIRFKVISLDTVQSTNDYAKSLSKSTPQEGTVILAHNQVNGKGQFGKNWESKPGKNLTISLVLCPEFLPFERLFVLNKAVALAVVDFCLPYLKTVKIKWPNDIYHNEKKIAGILIENNLSSNIIQSSIVGIGINVNQTTFSESIPNPSSLKLILNRDFDLKELLTQLLECLNKRYKQLKNGEHEKINNEYINCLYRLNVLSNFTGKQGNNFQGVIIGITPDGKLKLKVNGEVKTFGNQEVIFK